MTIAHAMVFAQVAPQPGQNLPGQQGGNQNQGGQNNNQGGQNQQGQGGQQGNNNTNTNAVVSLTRPKGVATFTPGYARLNTRTSAMRTGLYQKGVVTDPAILDPSLAGGAGGLPRGAGGVGGQAGGVGGQAGGVGGQVGTTPGTANNPNGITVAAGGNSASLGQNGLTLGSTAGSITLGQNGISLAGPTAGQNGRVAAATPARPAVGQPVAMNSFRNLSGSAATSATPTPRASFVAQRRLLRLQQVPVE